MKFPKAALLFVLILFGLQPVEALAQAFPDRPVKLIIPFGPGGGADPPGRMLADGLSKIWGQPVVVENRPGAGGNIGANAVAKADPDGYTLLFTNFAPLVINHSLYKDVPFNSREDFAPITQAFVLPLVLTVANNVPIKTVQELVAYAKARPGGTNYSSGGSGTATHLAAELFKQAAGINVVHVPYRTGSEMTRSVIAGEVAFNFNGPFVLPLAKAGEMKAIAVSTLQRSALAPEMPTVAEAGYPGFNVNAWGGLLAPAKTPPAIIAKIQADAVRVLTDPANVTKMASSGYELKPSSSDAFAKQIRDESESWAKVIKSADIRPN